MEDSCNIDDFCEEGKEIFEQVKNKYKNIVYASEFIKYSNGICVCGKCNLLIGNKWDLFICVKTDSDYKYLHYNKFNEYTKYTLVKKQIISAKYLLIPRKVDKDFNSLLDQQQYFLHVWTIADYMEAPKSRPNNINNICYILYEDEKQLLTPEIFNNICPSKN